MKTRSAYTIFFDIETGGLNHFPHVLNGVEIPMSPIIQIAAIAMENATEKEIRTFERKIIFSPDTASKEALEINHYDPSVWEQEAVSAQKAACGLTDFLRPFCDIAKLSKRGNRYYVANMCGHNAAKFDMPFLLAWFQLQGVFLPADLIAFDTLQIAKIYEAIFPDAVFENLQLSTIARALGLPEGTHDALEDVRATMAIYKAMMGRLRNCAASVQNMLSMQSAMCVPEREAMLERHDIGQEEPQRKEA